MSQRLVDPKAGQGGFTLVELIMVVAILGTLAVSAVPKFVDLSGEADQAAVDGVAGQLASAVAMNFAICAAKGANDSECVKNLDNCGKVEQLLLEGGKNALGSEYVIDGGNIGNGATKECTVKLKKAGAVVATSTFQAIDFK